MIKISIVTILIISSTIVFSQEVFGSVGQNFTRYNFKNSDRQEIPGLRSGNGRFFEGGMAFVISPDKKLRYALSLTLNQFNANAEILNKPYAWSTNYLGVQNVFIYQLFCTSTSLAIDIKAGFNASHIIYGKQNLNNKIYNISNNKEFTGIFIQPMLGIDITYLVTKNLRLSCGYNCSYAFNTHGAKNQKLGFLNNQIELSLFFLPVTHMLR